MTNELDRLKQVYIDRKNLKISYNPVLPENYYLLNSREKMFIISLLKYFGTNFENLKVLDLGFGSGIDIFTLIKSGFNIKNIYGVEVIEERFNNLKNIIPNANLKLNSGFNIPFESENFDLVIQSTVFSSILDKNSRKLLSNEILRVLKPNGKIFFYDLKFNNPWNKNVIKIDKNELKYLFENCKIKSNSLTLNPVIVREIAKNSIIICEILEKIPILCSHYYSIIEKK
ncbi:MAG: methyltransferase domain-containing protein [Candidatus Sericytochromatia bacterium]